MSRAPSSWALRACAMSCSYVAALMSPLTRSTVTGTRACSCDTVMSISVLLLGMGDTLRNDEGHVIRRGSLTRESGNGPLQRRGDVLRRCVAMVEEQTLQPLLAELLLGRIQRFGDAIRVQHDEIAGFKVNRVLREFGPGEEPQRHPAVSKLHAFTASGAAHQRRGVSRVHVAHPAAAPRDPRWEEGR